MKQRSTRLSAEWWIYVPAALVISVIVVLGFGPSYFYRPFIKPEDSLTLLVHVHGALMTAWIALFFCQVSLVAARRVDLHRRLGTYGIGLLAAIIVVSLPMTLIAAKLGGTHMPGPPLPALALVLSLLAAFITFAVFGFVFKHRSDSHKRFMLLASITAMEAGLIRLPLAFLDNPVKVHAANDLILLVIVVLDTIKNRRLHPVFLWGLLGLIAIQGFSLLIAGTAIWNRFAAGLLSTFFG